MARAALRWRVRELAVKTGINWVTINRFEVGNQDAKPETQSRLREEFEQAGVEFGEDGWVRLKVEEASED